MPELNKAINKTGSDKLFISLVLGCLLRYQNPLEITIKKTW
jgi:hypothetical protein